MDEKTEGKEEERSSEAAKQRMRRRREQCNRGHGCTVTCSLHSGPLSVSLLLDTEKCGASDVTTSVLVCRVRNYEHQLIPGTRPQRTKWFDSRLKCDAQGALSAAAHPDWNKYDNMEKLGPQTEAWTMVYWNGKLVMFGPKAVRLSRDVHSRIQNLSMSL